MVLRGCVRSRVSWWLLLKRREITRGDAVKYFAVRRSPFFEKTLFDELGDGLGNFRRPVPNAGVEHPPVKDSLDRVLCLRMPGQVVENFRRRRWKRRVGSTHWGVSHPPVAIGVPANFRCRTRTRIVCLQPLVRVSIPPLKMRSLNRVSVR